MHSFSAMTKVQKEKKNTSPRTAPAMSCSRLKIRLEYVSSIINHAYQNDNKLLRNIVRNGS